MILWFIIYFTLITSEQNAGFNDCRSNNCDLSSTRCIGTGGGSFLCDCKFGFEKILFNNRSCKDINECVIGGCDISSTTCENMMGSFRCHCKPGFQPESTSRCWDINECQNNKHRCDTNVSFCINALGSYLCQCKSGYVQNIYNSLTCSDVDECLANSHKCDLSTTTCTNIEGSYRCDCKLGFEKVNLNDMFCTDVDECLETDKYDSMVTCTNLFGGSAFSCPKGFYLDEEGDKLTCKAPSHAGNVAAGLMSVVVLILGILFFIYWRRTKILNQFECQPVKDNLLGDLELKIEQQIASGDGQYETTTQINTCMNEYINAGPKKVCKFESELKNLYKKSLDEIKDSLSPTEIIAQSDKWKVYSADGVNIPNKYIFASFPSESDVDKFWEICMKHSSIIVLIDQVKDAEPIFLPNKKKSLKYKEFKLELINTMKAGFAYVDSISASLEENDTYENITDSKIKENQFRRFSIIRVKLKNIDFLKEIFLAIKKQTDLLSSNNSSERCIVDPIFVLSRNDMKLASLYVACCKCLYQMEFYMDDADREIYENVQ